MFLTSASLNQALPRVGSYLLIFTYYTADCRQTQVSCDLQILSALGQVKGQQPDIQRRSELERFNWSEDYQRSVGCRLLRISGWSWRYNLESENTNAVFKKSICLSDVKMKKALTLFTG